MKLISSTLQKITEYYYRNQSECGRIFMFHQVLDIESSESTNNLCIRMDEFIKFIKALQMKGTIKEIDNLFTESKKDYFYLTFDDIYLNAYQNAIKWLCDNNIPFTIFVTCEFLDKEKYITIDQLIEISQNPLCTIGAHTLTHPLLRDLDVKAIKLELSQSKKDIEDIINRPVDLLAYPYGSRYACPKKVVNIARESGYKMAFSTYSIGLNNSILNKSKYFIPRINVSNEYIRNWKEKYGCKC